MRVKITNPKVVFDLQLNRRVTIIRGESASGKSWVNEIIRIMDDTSLIECERNVLVAPTVINGRERETLNAYNNSLLFIDESNIQALSKVYADAVMDLDIWVVISARTVKSYPYSADEVYSLRTSGKIKTLTKYYTHETNNRRYANNILTEDSGSGYDLLKKQGLNVHSAGGKDNIKNKLADCMTVVFDKAAIGYRYDMLYKGAVKGVLDLIEPESFEWVLLHSDIFKGNSDIEKKINDPGRYGANDFKTWENFFTEVLSKALDKYQNVNYIKGNLSRCFTIQCCVKTVPCDLYSRSKSKLENLLAISGMAYLVGADTTADKLRKLMPPSMSRLYSDEELVSNFSHLLEEV